VRHDVGGGPGSGKRLNEADCAVEDKKRGLHLLPQPVLLADALLPAGFREHFYSETGPVSDISLRAHARRFLYGSMAMFTPWLMCTWWYRLITMP